MFGVGGGLTAYDEEGCEGRDAAESHGWQLVCCCCRGSCCLLLSLS